MCKEQTAVTGSYDDIGNLPSDDEVIQSIRDMLKGGITATSPMQAPRAALELIMTLAVSEGDTFCSDESLKDALYWITHQALVGLTQLEDERRAIMDMTRAYRPTFGEAA